VGTTYTDQSAAYVNTDPRVVPQFDATGAPVPGTSSGSDTASGTTQIAPFAITASGGGKQLRGAHDHQFVHTLTVTNNTANATDGAAVDDYLPAGLEFLGCGTADNTTNAPTNPNAGIEYPNAVPLNAGNQPPLAADCPTPSLVETVSDPPGLAPGTYTHVQWDLGVLAPAEVTTIEYVTAIPIRENTTTWSQIEPPAAGLGQTANLDNNSGPETRQNQSLVTSATVSGQYQGPMAPGTPPTETASTTLTNVVKDLMLTKTASSSRIGIGGTTTWTLALNTSEYRGATAIAVTDTLPNGLCPLGASAASYGSEPDCLAASVPGTGPSPPYTSATENPDGSWTITWTPADMPTNGTQKITFQSLTRAAYQTNGADTTPVLAGDAWTNNASLTGGAVVRTEHRIEIDHDPSYGDGAALTDSSGAGQSAAQPSISKWVATPASVVGGVCPTDPADYVPTLAPSTSYRPGDLVCWRVRVNFGQDLNTQVSTLSDFLPAGQTYAPGSVAALSDNTLNGVTTPDTSTAGLLVWSGLTVKSAGGTIIPTGGQVFDAVFGSTGAPPEVAAPGQIVQNAAKLQTTNTAGVSSSPRADATYTVSGPQLSVLKGVSTVTRDGTVIAGPNGPNVDGTPVQPGDAVTFRIDVTNTGANPAIKGVIWDVLPPKITCADAAPLASTTHPVAVACVTVPGLGDVVEWNGINVPADGSTTLDVTYTVPLGVFSSSAVLTDTAGVVEYADGAQTGNSGDGYVYVPTDNIDPNAGAANAPAASDPSNVVISSPTITKTATTSITEPGNSAAQATIGETVAYTVDVALIHDTVKTNATLVDPIPPGLVLDTSSVQAAFTEGSLPPTGLPSGWTLKVTPTQITIILPYSYTVPSDGVTVTLTFSGTIADVPANRASGTLVNTATVTTYVGGTPNASSASASTPIVEPAITVAKQDNAGGQPVAAGQSVTYTVLAANRSGGAVSTAHDAVVTDNVPAGLCVDTATITPSATVSGNCTAGQTITWNVGTLAPGASAPLVYSATVGGGQPAGTSLTNTVTAAASSVEAGGRTYAATASDTVVTSNPDLTKTRTSDPALATAGSEVPYQLSITIPANETLPSATLADQLPAGFAFVTQTSAGCGGCGLALPSQPQSTGNPVTWQLGDIPSAPGPRTITFRYTVLVSATAPFGGHTNTGTLSWVANGRTQSLTDTAYVATAQPNLALTKTLTCNGGANNLTDHTCNVTAGAPLAYTVAVTNTGKWHAYDATITDTPPSGLTSIGAISGGGTYAGGVITWHLAGPIAPGQRVALTYTASVTSDTSTLHDGQTLTNTARVGTYYGLSAADRQAHPNDAITYPGGSNDADVVTVILPSLAISKTHVGDLPRGGTGTYDITVTNIGTHPTTAAVTVTDTPPGGMMPLAAGGPGWQCTIKIRTMTCTRGDALQVGDSFPPISLEVAIASNAPDTLVNLASATGGGGRPETVTDEDAANIIGPITDARLEITKTVNSHFIKAGQLAHYTIAVHHPGPSAVFDAVVCDKIPPYTSFVSAPGATFVHGEACWSIPYLAVGHTEHFFVTVRISASAPPTGLVNTATVAARNAPPARATAKVRVITRHKPRPGGVTG
jgi:fimbrial isopeptide formation D2 family protein/uncharacterized repeat protein (TIGR01451 family)